MPLFPIRYKCTVLVYDVSTVVPYKSTAVVEPSFTGLQQLCSSKGIIRKSCVTLKEIDLTNQNLSVLGLGYIKLGLTKLKAVGYIWATGEA